MMSIQITERIARTEEIESLFQLQLSPPREETGVMIGAEMRENAAALETKSIETTEIAGVTLVQAREKGEAEAGSTGGTIEITEEEMTLALAEMTESAAAALKGERTREEPLPPRVPRSLTNRAWGDRQARRGGR